MLAFKMTQSLFIRYNQHLAFFKPELRLFLSLNGIDTSALSYSNIIDILDGRPVEEMQRFLDENFKMEGVVECMEDQLPFVASARVVVCHILAEEAKGTIKLDNTTTRFFILNGRKQRVEVKDSTLPTTVFHKGAQAPHAAKHNIEQGRYTFDFSMGLKVPELGETEPVKFIPLSANSNDKPKASTIYVADPLRHTANYLNHPVSSVTCDDNILVLNEIEGKPQRPLLLVHGKPKPGGLQRLISRAVDLTVLFVDLCEGEVAEIDGKDRSLHAITNPKLRHPTTNPYIKAYLDGHVISEIALSKHNVTPQMCYPFDMFYNILYKRKRHLDGFAKAIARITKEDTSQSEGELKKDADKTKQKLYYESLLETQKRLVLLERFDVLKTTRHVLLSPYIPETVCIDDLVVNQNKTLKRMIEMKDTTVEPPMVFIDVPATGDHVVEGHIKVSITLSKDSRCYIKNCGLVIVKGVGSLVVCGQIHSLVAINGVKVRLDNTSPEDFDDDVYLFIEGSNIYDAVGRWRDMKPQELLSYTTQTGGNVGAPKLTSDFIRNKAIVRTFISGTSNHVVGIHTASIDRFIEMDP